MQIGVSTYDYQYGTCRCVYCNKPVIMHNNSASAENTLNVYFQEEVERRRRKYPGADFYLTVAEEEELRKLIEEVELGECIGYEQCIHYRCLEVIQSPEKKDVLERIRLSNRQNMELPDADHHILYELNYCNLIQCINYCAYCHREINVHAQGFAYCRKEDKAKKKCLFLHDTCYATLKEIRCHEKQLALHARRTFMHQLMFPLSKTASVKKVALRNEGWLSFLKQYELDFEERHLFNTWLATVEQKKRLVWLTSCDQQIWLHHVTEDLEELSRLIREKEITDENLAILEMDLVREPEPVYPFCTIPAPKSVISPLEMDVEAAPDVYCLSGNFKPPTLPKQLHINLVRSLRQRIREDA